MQRDIKGSSRVKVSWEVLLPNVAHPVSRGQLLTVWTHTDASHTALLLEVGVCFVSLSTYTG